jgi:hypothetical protein
LSEKPESSQTPDQRALRVVFKDDDHVVVTFERVFVVIWQGETALASVQRVQGLAREHALALPTRRYCLLHVVERSSTEPTSATRAALAEMLKAHEPLLIASAVAHEGSGFRAAAVLAVATSIALLSRRGFPHRVFSELQRATDWLATQLSAELGQPMSGRALFAAVQRSRATPADKFDVARPPA